MIHQDFIARIRYSNALPPPPNPPKLLDIPNTGLASGQYTNPGFASRLAREQPLNIEADAELGMPLDLVGMPGIFDGDESCWWSIPRGQTGFTDSQSSYSSAGTSSRNPSARPAVVEAPGFSGPAKGSRSVGLVPAPDRIHLVARQQAPRQCVGTAGAFGQAPAEAETAGSRGGC